MTAPYESTGPAPNGTIGSTLVEHPICTQLVHDKYSCGFPWSQECVDAADTLCRYPGTEKRVFRWIEGSFYGNLFGSHNLNPSKPQIRVNKMFQIESLKGDTWITDGGEYSRAFIGVAYPNMFACASDNWTEREAYIAMRVCAGPDPLTEEYTRDCAAAYVGRCYDVCEKLDASPQGDFDAAFCSGNKQTWATPMTTVLAQPCDAITDPATCATAPGAPIFPM
jgi:hypothetical protein